MQKEEVVAKLGARTGTRARAVQSGMMIRALNAPEGVTVTEIDLGSTKGVLYNRAGTQRAVLIAHGLTGARHSFTTFCTRLASFGFCCLSIDLPGHGASTEQFSLGAVSEAITTGVKALHDMGFARVAVIGHSLGAVGALFSCCGYSKTVEHEFYAVWEHIKTLTVKLADADDAQRKRLLLEIEDSYSVLKKVIATSLQTTRQMDIRAFVILAPPLNSKAVVPGLSLLRLLPRSTIRAITQVLHKGSVERLKQLGTPPERMPVQDDVSLQYFHTPDVHEFLDYFLSMKEPADFISVLEAIIAFRRKDAQVSYFEYYYAKYVMAKPKLFIYGKKDTWLRPFLPFARGRLEKMFHAFGDVKIEYLDIGHLFNENPWQTDSFETVKESSATVAIMDFLDKNV